MMKAPSFAARAGPEYSAALEKLAEDEELGPVFKEIKEKGMEAMQKHWDDTELMEKIAAKMRDLQVVKEPGTPKRDDDAVADGGSIKKPASAAPVVSSGGPDLHALAKAGDAKGIAAALKKKKDEKEGKESGDGDGGDEKKEGGASPSSSSSSPDPNARDARGITPLGLAVGYNKLDVVEALLEGGALVDGTDARGSTALHYASGYGRIELVKLLLKRGADVRKRNDAGQSPLDVATVNREVKAVKVLERALAEKEGKEGLFV
jgi:Ankyrin repeats (3 copies)